MSGDNEELLAALLKLSDKDADALHVEYLSKLTDARFDRIHYVCDVEWSKRLKRKKGEEMEDEDELEPKRFLSSEHINNRTLERLREVAKGHKVSPSVAMKASLRAARIEKMQLETGGLSAGRKMWSDSETRSMIKIWQEESARVWASAGKKILSLKVISERLKKEADVERDISQVEGKIKALKRDYKAVKAGKAINSVQNRMSPYLDILDNIFLRESTE